MGHHHDFSAIDGMDFQVLAEADILVNALEGKIPGEVLLELVGRVFRTEAGRREAQKILAR
ncbi:MAG: hypothetical protein H5U36_00360 [Candidatus Caldatribacterium sp.]|nr:hypothetical protein [Candidatus Caldatribacterium sp.]